MVIGRACSNLLSTFDLVRKCQIWAFNKTQITRTWINLYRPLDMHYMRTHVGDTLKLIVCVLFKTNENTFRNEKCKVTFGFEYSVPLYMV